MQIWTSAWDEQPIQHADEVNLSRKEAKSRTRGLRSNRAKARTYVDPVRESQSELEKKLEARTRELAEALDQQAATSEVLSVISSSPTDVQAVLDAVVGSAARLCEALDAVIVLCDGDVVVPRAHSGPLGATNLGQRLPLNRRWVTGRAVLEARTIHVPDLLVGAVSRTLSRSCPSFTRSASTYSCTSRASTPGRRQARRCSR